MPLFVFNIGRMFILVAYHHSLKYRYRTQETWGLQFGHMMTSSNGNIFRVTGPLCGEFTGPGEFPTQRTVTRSFVVFFDLRLNKRLSKQPSGWWFETLSWSLWRQCNVFLPPTVLLHCWMVEVVGGCSLSNSTWAPSVNKEETYLVNIGKMHKETSFKFNSTFLKGDCDYVTEKNGASISLAVA